MKKARLVKKVIAERIAASNQQQKEKIIIKKMYKYTHTQNNMMSKACIFGMIKISREERRKENKDWNHNSLAFIH